MENKHLPLIKDSALFVASQNYNSDFSLAYKHPAKYENYIISLAACNTSMILL